jgi:hypothetical protein
MGLFTVSQIKNIIKLNQTTKNEMQTKAYEALLDNLKDDHIINMTTAFRLH